MKEFSDLIYVFEDLETKLNENSVAILVLLDHTKAVDHKVLFGKFPKLFKNILI